MKALIIGGGVAAEIHCKVLDALHVTVAGIYDIRLSAAQELAQKHNAKAFDDLAAALREDIDFAVICTPSGTHAKLAIQVMRAGKNVVVEKPLALTPWDCDAVLQTAKQTGRLCAPISQLRFSPMYKKVRDCLDKQELGTLVMASLSMKYFRSREYYAGTWKGTKSMDGGELMNQGIHGIDIMCGLLGKPTSVSGKVATRYHEIEAEDTAVAHLTFPNGMLGAIDSSTAVSKSKPRRFEICGSDGLIVVEEDRITLAEGVMLEKEEFGEYRGSHDPRDIGLNLHSLIYQNILAAMEGKAALEYTAEDAANTVRVICAIYESSETGKIIDL